ncbi:MAG: hypothetical protein ACYTGW_02935 [Planctomycetota bacterium]
MRDTSHRSCALWFIAVLCVLLASTLQAARPQEPEAAKQKPPETQKPEAQEPETRKPETQTPETTPSPGFPIHGALSLRYRYRNAEDDGTDQDMLGVLSLSAGDPDRHRFTFHFLGSGTWDMDGSAGDNDFNSVADSYDSMHGLLYDAYLDIHRVKPFDVVRLGRQTAYDTPIPVSFDGALLETEGLGEKDIRVGAFGGISNHLHESSPSGDFVVGAFVSGVPWEAGKLRFDWFHAADDTRLKDHDNDLLGFRAWQGVGDHTRLHAGYTMLDGESRDVTARSTTYVASCDLQVQATYYQLLKTQGSLALEVDPFYDSAFDYYPYYQFQGLVAKGFGDHFNVTSGVDLRRLRDGGDEAKFNREYDHVYMTPVFEDVLVEGLSVSFTGDYWGSEGGEDVTSWGADATMQVDEQIQASVGTYYSLYKHDFVGNRERDRVRSYYLNLEYRLETVRFRVGYEFEHDEFEDYHEVEGRMVWTF